MPVSRKIYKDIRGCNTPLAGSDPPDLGESRERWERSPRQNILKTASDVVVIASSSESRQEQKPQNVDRANVVQLHAIDLQACAIAIAYDGVRHVNISEAMLAYRVAHGFCIEPHEAAQVIRLFHERRTALRETLNLYKGAR